jgi:hypothetical protein
MQKKSATPISILAMLSCVVFGQTALPQTCTLDQCPDIQPEGARLFGGAWYGTAWDRHDYDDNGVIDCWEQRLFLEVLCSSTHSLKNAAVCAYEANLNVLRTEGLDLSSVEHLLAIMVSVSTSSQTSTKESYFLSKAYTVVESPPRVEPFSAEGDVDGDGFTNGQEAANVAAYWGSPDEYVLAALDPARDGSECDGTLESCPSVMADMASFYATFDWLADWLAGDWDDSGIIDRWEMDLFTEVLCGPPGALQQATVCTFKRNLASIRREPGLDDGFESLYEDFLAAGLSMSSEYQAKLLLFLTSLYGPLLEPYEVVAVGGSSKAPNEPFAADGDLDRDGKSNLVEFTNAEAHGLTMEEYVLAAQNPLLDGTQPPSALPMLPITMMFGAGLLGVAGCLRVRRSQDR